MTPAVFFLTLAAGAPAPPVLHLAGPVELGKSERWALVGFSPDGRTLATAAKTTWRKAGPIRLWDTRTGRQRTALAAGWDKLETIRFSPDGSLVAAHDGKRGMGVWDARTGKRVAGFRPPTPFGNWVNFWFSPDGRSVLYQDHGEESSLKVWDIKAGRERAAIKGEPRRFAFSPDGRRLATGTTAPTHDRRDAVMLWAWDPGKVPALLKKHPLAAEEVAFSPDLRKFATAAARKGPGGAVEVRVRDMATGRTLATLSHRDPETHIQSLTFSPDGRLLMARRGGGTKLNWKTKATVWDITARPPSVLGTWAEAPAFSPNGRLLAVPGESRVVLRGVGAGKAKGELTRPGDTADPGVRMTGWTPLPSVLFSPDGRLVAVTRLYRGLGGLPVARVWQVDPLREVRALDGCVQVLFSPRGRELAALSGEGSLKVWAVSRRGGRPGR